MSQFQPNSPVDPGDLGRTPAATNWSNFYSQATTHLPRSGTEVSSPGEGIRTQMNTTDPMPFGPDSMEESEGSRASQYSS